MEERLNAISWEAPEHYHSEKSGDWYWALGIIALCGAVAAFLFGNFLFAIVILVGAGVMSLQSNKHPRIVPFLVGARGVRVGEQLFPYSALESYSIDEDDFRGPRLLLKAKHLYTPLIVMPIPEDRVQDIEDLVRERLKEEGLEEPLANRLLNMIGF